MGKNNRAKTKAKKTRHKTIIGGMKDQIRRWGLEQLRKQTKKDKS